MNTQPQTPTLFETGAAPKAADPKPEKTVTKKKRAAAADKKPAAAPPADPPKPKSTAVTVHQPKPPAEPKAPKITSAMQMLQFIGTAAMNKDVDPAKMRELLSIRKELHDEETLAAYTAALVKVQKALQHIKITRKGTITIYAKNDPEHRNPPIQSTPYAKYEHLVPIIRPVLMANGFVVQHKNGATTEGKVILITKLLHEKGHSESSEFVGEIDASGSKNNVQGRGSTISYGKRYNVTSLLDLITEDDDDGNQGKEFKIDVSQHTRLLEAIEGKGMPKTIVLNAYNIKALEDLPASKFVEAMDRIEKAPARTPEKGAAKK